MASFSLLPGMARTALLDGKYPSDTHLGPGTSEKAQPSLLCVFWGAKEDVPCRCFDIANLDMLVEGYLRCL